VHRNVAARADTRRRDDDDDDAMATAAATAAASGDADGGGGTRKRARDGGSVSAASGGDGGGGRPMGTAATTTTTERGATSSGGEKSEGGLGGSLYKRRGRMRGGKGREFARRLIDFRGFDLSEAQANDIARFIDLLPEEMEERVRETLENCSNIDDAIGQLANVKMVEQTAQCSVGDFSEAEISEAHSAGGASRGHARTGDGETATATSSAPVLTMEWVNAVVSEMGASVDMADAQTRASRVLQMFEGAVRQRCAEFTDYSKVMKMKRENALLKRAVAIQNSRMQELAPLQARVRELEAACAQYDDQLKAAERQNYSLSVNLRLAMAEQSQSPFGEGSRNHDVF
tara:strand:- start:1308 stop:2342 length:1035 start_codon:yes stop_codon:yes gene_type:complete